MAACTGAWRGARISILTRQRPRMRVMGAGAGREKERVHRIGRHDAAVLAMMHGSHRDVSPDNSRKGIAYFATIW